MFSNYDFEVDRKIEIFSQRFRTRLISHHITNTFIGYNKPSLEPTTFYITPKMKEVFNKEI